MNRVVDKPQARRRPQKAASPLLDSKTLTPVPPLRRARAIRRISGALTLATAACLTTACIGGLIPDSEQFLAEAQARSAAGCDAGNVSDCAKAGDARRSGAPGTTKDLDEAERYYKLACRDGATEHCRKLTGLAHDYAKGSGLPQDESKALALFEYACSVNDGFGCVQVGHFHEYGKSTPKNEKRAIEHYEKACATNQSTACTRMGERYLDGRGVAKNTDKAQVYLVSACDRKNAEACDLLGHLYRDGGGVAKDLEKAADYLGRACDGEKTGSCHTLGLMYRDGNGVARDDARAFQLLKISCETRSRWDGPDRKKGNAACAELGGMYETGRGTQADKAEAARSWSLSCDTGERDPVGCRKIGLALLNGDPLPAHLRAGPNYAYPMLDRACSLGDKPACEARRKVCAQLKYCQ
jgi:uncharacterized protein